MRVSLLDRTQGSTADYIYRRMQASPAGRIRAVERETAALRRFLVRRVRVPQGVELGDDRIEVDFNHGSGRMLFHSDDESVTIERNPYQNPNAVNFEVASAGCTAVVKTITDHGDTSQSATDCNGELEFDDGNGYICFIHNGSPPNMVLDTYWCAPEGDAIEPAAGDPFNFPTPDVWILLAVGDECSQGACVQYVVPGWNAT